MILFKSAWVVPVSGPPIREGAVAVESGTIVALGSSRELLARFSGSGVRACPHDEGPTAGGARPLERIVDAGDAVLLPGLINAHTHLELSWMKGESLPRGDFLAWVRAMISRRTASDEEVRAAVTAAVRSMIATGTAGVGDVGNTAVSALALADSGLEGCFFLELIGIDPEEAPARFEAAARLADETLRLLTARVARDGIETRTGTETRAPSPTAAPSPPSPSDSVREPPSRPIAVSVVPHAAHSVSGVLLRRIADRARRTRSILSVHLAESAAEDGLLRSGGGPFRQLFMEQDLEPPQPIGPGSSPTRFLDESGLIGPATVAVHGVHLASSDVRLLSERGATIVLCPRSNERLGVGPAPIGLFLEEGVRLALGTDSLASNEDLDMREELAALRRLAPQAPPEALVRAATLGGAEALGLGETLGSFETGKRAAILALSRTAGGRSADAEPYGTLFAGARETDLRWLSGAPGEVRGTAPGDPPPPGPR